MVGAGDVGRRPGSIGRSRHVFAGVRIGMATADSAKTIGRPAGMKHRLLDWLQCPWCGGAFAVESFTVTDGGDVEEGVLRCRCGRVFPIVRGIPRILADAYALNPDFVARYRSRLPATLPHDEPAEAHAEAIRSTRD